jgi:hypothetical protein
MRRYSLCVATTGARRIRRNAEGVQEHAALPGAVRGFLAASRAAVARTCAGVRDHEGIATAEIVCGVQPGTTSMATAMTASMAPLAQFDLAAPDAILAQVIFIAFRGPGPRADQLRKLSRLVSQISTDRSGRARLRLPGTEERGWFEVTPLLATIASIVGCGPPQPLLDR